MSAEKRREYGTGSTYQRKSDGRWVGTYEAGYTKTGGRRRRAVYGKTEAVVKRRLRDKLADLERDQHAEFSSRTTVKTWGDTWLDMDVATARPETYRSDHTAVRLWIVPAIGHRRLDQLTPADRRTVIKAMQAAGLKPSTMLRYDGVLVRMLNAAINEGATVSPRVFKVKRPPAGETDRQAMSTPEAVAILQTAATYLPHASRWVAAFLQGTRQGETLGLTWPMVDFENDLLNVSWQLQRLPYLDKRDRSKGFRVPVGYVARQLHLSLHLVRPKTASGTRVLPLVPWMRQALLGWRDLAPASPHGLVWPRLDGGPCDREDDRVEWEALQCTAEVGHPAGRYYKGHEARHTTATLLMELGVPESVRIAIMGHSSIATTRGYEHADRALALAALQQVAGRLQLEG